MGISEKAIITGDEILMYIPQRAPIVMVDSFFGIDETLSVSGLTITEDNLFADNGFFTENGVMEHMAQSAALRSGYENISQGCAVPIGFIGAVNNFEVFALPRVQDCLLTELRVEQTVMNITLVAARTCNESCGGELVASCKMKIYLHK